MLNPIGVGRNCKWLYSLQLRSYHPSFSNSISFQSPLQRTFPRPRDFSSTVASRVSLKVFWSEPREARNPPVAASNVYKGQRPASWWNGAKSSGKYLRYRRSREVRVHGRLARVNKSGELPAGERARIKREGERELLRWIGTRASRNPSFHLRVAGRDSFRGP